MTNKQNELVTVKLDKERHLKLTMKGMVEFERVTGKNPLKGLDVNEMTLTDIAALVFACLIHEDKELQFDDVLNMIDLSNMNIVTEAVTDCITQLLPK